MKKDLVVQKTTKKELLKDIKEVVQETLEDNALNPALPNTTPLKDVNTCEEAAKYLGISSVSLRKKAAAGKISYHKDGEGKEPLSFTMEHIIEYLKKYERKTTQ